jgi:anti-anti-sigma regulatory factor
MKLFELDAQSRALYLEGRFRSLSEANFVSIFDEACRQVPGNLVLDFSGVEHIDGGGLSLLVPAGIRARDCGLRLAAIGLNDDYQRIFRIAGLDGVVRLSPDDAATLAGLGIRDTGAYRYARREYLASRPSAAGQTPQHTAGWLAGPGQLKLPPVPRGAIGKYVAGRYPQGPAQGFGTLWEETYRLMLGKIAPSPEEIIARIKAEYTSLMPPQNRAYLPPEGIVPGAVVLTEMQLRSGVISTALQVLYADAVSFTLITPQGHQGSGWVTFAAYQDGGNRVLQIQGLARAADPLDEITFRLSKVRRRERVWRYFLQQVAARAGVTPLITAHQVCLAPHLQWSQLGNLRYSARCRALPRSLRRTGGSDQTKSN